LNCDNSDSQGDNDTAGDNASVDMAVVRQVDGGKVGDRDGKITGKIWNEEKHEHEEEQVQEEDEE